MDGMINVMTLATVLAPIILAVIEVIKRTVAFKKNVVPLISLLVGIIVGIAAVPFTELDIIYRMWAGAFAGLSATGLFELVANRSGYTKGADE